MQARKRCGRTVTGVACTWGQDRSPEVSDPEQPQQAVPVPRKRPWWRGAPDQAVVMTMTVEELDKPALPVTPKAPDVKTIVVEEAKPALPVTPKAPDVTTIVVDESKPAPPVTPKVKDSWWVDYIHNLEPGGPDPPMPMPKRRTPAKATPRKSVQELDDIDAWFAEGFDDAKPIATMVLKSPPPPLVNDCSTCTSMPTAALSAMGPPRLCHPLVSFEHLYTSVNCVFLTCLLVISWLPQLRCCKLTCNTPSRYFYFCAKGAHKRAITEQRR